MKSYWENWYSQARQSVQKIVLAEGEDERVIQAACLLSKQRLAQPVLLGLKETILKKSQELRMNLEGVEILDPKQYPSRANLEQIYWELRKSKGMTQEQAREQLSDPLVFGCLLVRQGLANGFVGGAVRTTADTVRAAFSCLGLAPGASTLFGFFLVEISEPHPYAGMYLLADCAVIPDPSPRQLANVAEAAGQAYRQFVGQTPRVALLSFSTMHSADNPLVDKIRKAVDLAKAKRSDIVMDGELQVDAALDPEVARRKGASPEQGVAGQANVLIFPNLDAGNISYKLVQRLAQARCAGPVLWGLSGAANDLSRGCTVQEIVDTCVLTALEAQSLKEKFQGQKI